MLPAGRTSSKVMTIPITLLKVGVEAFIRSPLPRLLLAMSHIIAGSHYPAISPGFTDRKYNKKTTVPVSTEAVVKVNLSYF
jgi:hypothetical protein